MTRRIREWFNNKGETERSYVMASLDIGKEMGGGEPAHDQLAVSAEMIAEEQEEDAQEKIVQLEGAVESLQKELAAANQAVVVVERRAQIEQEVSRAKAVDVETACLLTEVAISEMDEPDVSLAVRELRSRKPFLFCGALKSASVSSMGAMAPSTKQEDLESMAGKARLRGDRSELLRYLRARRGC
jgi:predicted transcriptional regulator